jgi:hypothetical protein
MYGIEIFVNAAKPCKQLLPRVAETLKQVYMKGVQCMLF